MANTSILGAGQSALTAAQTGLVTTGHNIANVNTPGYSRQVVVQSASAGQDIGVGFIGKGTEVSTIRRVFNEFLHNQVVAGETTKGAIDSFYAQIKQIDNMLADATSGISSTMQDFFEGIQDVAANPGSAASRQAMLSSAEAMAARFDSIGGRLDEMRQSLNGQITSSISAINTYAQQIGALNDAIEKAQGTAGEGKPANDLLDQRDQVIAELSKEVKVSVVKQGNSYNVFMGSGQALTVGTQVFKLTAAVNTTDASKLQLAYVSNGTMTRIPDSSITGGKLGGLLDFRNNSLDVAQNELGRVAIGLAETFNAQHRLGQDQTGALGGAFFTTGTPRVNASTANTGTGAVTATITDASQLTASDYRITHVGGNFTVTRLSDNTTFPTFTTFPQTIDGITIASASAPASFGANDEYVIQPTREGATSFGVAISDIKNIAAAAPIRTAVATTNTGTASVSAGTVNATNVNLQQPVTITFNADGTYNVNGTGTGNPVNQAYTSGGNISYNGWTIQISGTPSAGDTFTIGPNTGGVGDNRNALKLAGLQTANTLEGGMTYQNAYTEMVSRVGNKTRELEVTGKAEEKLLAAAIQAHQSESGVNLDEEAANLMRYQQAYQAAAKVMQTASQLFEMLLELGGA
ncbi:flagellar hook-associated protein FlgK [Noviherbaspirillum sp. ST9]|uniref:flagellar hook-associated protein FlgK n=1 Tax=Noviherbaspirillum sp. ST9 TaxID=3401606 RepID=UPI003B58AD18